VKVKTVFRPINLKTNISLCDANSRYVIGIENIIGHTTMKHNLLWKQTWKFQKYLPKKCIIKWNIHCKFTNFYCFISNIQNHQQV